jgi:GDP-L-fucose synthase
MIRDLIELTPRLTGFAGEIRWDPSNPDDQPHRALDTRRAHEAVGFSARRLWEDDLRATIDRYESRRGADS